MINLKFFIVFFIVFLNAKVIHSASMEVGLAPNQTCASDNGSNRLICCGFEFGSKLCLLMHSYVVHGISVKADQNLNTDTSNTDTSDTGKEDNRDKQTTCQCGWTLHSNVKRHTRIHNPENGSYICESCKIPSYFPNLGSLAIHKKTHYSGSYE